MIAVDELVAFAKQRGYKSHRKGYRCSRKGSWQYDDQDIERLGMIMTLHGIGYPRSLNAVNCVNKA
mgnify:FL=1